MMGVQKPRDDPKWMKAARKRNDKADAKAAAFAYHAPSDSDRFAHLTGKQDPASRAEQGEILARASARGDADEAARPKSPFGGLWGT